jgi:HAD superfamily hydrolase (TIGR01509 family)
MNQAILFDFDGTLFQGTPELNTWCFKGALESMRLPPVTQDMIDQSIGLTFRQISILMTRTEDEEVLAHFKTETFRALPEYVERYIRPDPDVHAMLAELKKHARLAICSNAAPEYLLPMLEALKLFPFFDEIWYHTPGRTKAIAIPLLMKELQAECAIFVGDRLEDVLSAREAGIPVVGIRNRAYPEETDTADAVVINHSQMLEAILRLLNHKEE